MITKFAVKMFNILMLIKYRAQKTSFIDFYSQINPKVIKGNKIAGTKKSPNFINNCKLGNIQLGFGCRLSDIVCHGNVKIGNYVSVSGPGTKIVSSKEDITIGNFCSIAANVIIQEHMHDYQRITTYFIRRNVLGLNLNEDIISRGPILIGDDVWIGSNVVVLSGITIGRGSVIGAGSVVTKDIPPYSIVVGNPARVIRKRFDDDVIKNIEKSKWWTWDKERILQHPEFFLANNISEFNDWKETYEH